MARARRASAIHDIHDRGAAYNMPAHSATGSRVRRARYRVRGIVARQGAEAPPDRHPPTASWGTRVRLVSGTTGPIGAREYERGPALLLATCTRTLDLREESVRSTTRSRPSCRTRGLADRSRAAAGSALRGRPGRHDELPPPPQSTMPVVLPRRPHRRFASHSVRRPRLPHCGGVPSTRAPTGVQGPAPEFGEIRVVDTPSRAWLRGVAVGAARVGCAPSIEFMTWNSRPPRARQVVNVAAKMPTCRRAVRAVLFPRPNGAALQLAAQHSQCGVVARPQPRLQVARRAAVRAKACSGGHPRRQPVCFLEGRCSTTPRARCPRAST